MGYFRDDKLRMELILDEKGQEQLNRLWHEFDYISGLHRANGARIQLLTRRAVRTFSLIMADRYHTIASFGLVWVT
jgi:hypothetical protein